MSQLQHIKEMLEQDGQIDNFAAMNSRLTLRLAMHIHLLRQRGWVITTEVQPDKNTIYKLVSARSLNN